MNPKIEKYFENTEKWIDEQYLLRSILLDCGLDEQLKWGSPCYSIDNKNVVILQSFKNYCALMFFKGVLLSNPNNILVDIGQNSQVGKQARFTNTKKIEQLERQLKEIVFQAIEVEKAGLKVEKSDRPKVQIPEEFQQKLNEIPALKEAFENLTPGRQRAYIFYFSSAKQSKTRVDQIEKYIPQILAGKGYGE